MNIDCKTYNIDVTDETMIKFKNYSCENWAYIINVKSINKEYINVHVINKGVGDDHLSYGYLNLILELINDIHIFNRDIKTLGILKGDFLIDLVEPNITKLIIKRFLDLDLLDVKLKLSLNRLGI